MRLGGMVFTHLLYVWRGEGDDRLTLSFPLTEDPRPIFELLEAVLADAQRSLDELEERLSQYEV